MTVHRMSPSTEIVERVRWELDAEAPAPGRRSVTLVRVTIPGQLVDGYRMIGEMVGHRVVIGRDSLDLGTRKEALEILALLHQAIEEWPT